VNIIERIFAPRGYRCDDKFPINHFKTSDGFQIEIGLPSFVDEVFLRINKN
jgi:hypothetical protein